MSLIYRNYPKLYGKVFGVSAEEEADVSFLGQGGVVGIENEGKVTRG